MGRVEGVNWCFDEKAFVRRRERGMMDAVKEMMECEERFWMVEDGNFDIG